MQRVLFAIAALVAAILVGSPADAAGSLAVAVACEEALISGKTEKVPTY